MTIILGKKYRDVVTGFAGIAVSRHEYLNGCVRISLQPSELQDGKPIDSVSFDLEQLVLEGDGVTLPKRDTGGPGDIPAPRMEPREHSR